MSSDNTNNQTYGRLTAVQFILKYAVILKLGGKYNDVTPWRVLIGSWVAGIFHISSRKTKLIQNCTFLTYRGIVMQLKRIVLHSYYNNMITK